MFTDQQCHTKQMFSTVFSHFYQQNQCSRGILKKPLYLLFIYRLLSPPKIK